MVGGVYSCIGLYRFLYFVLRYCYSFIGPYRFRILFLAVSIVHWRKFLVSSTVVRHRDFVGAPAHADENSIESVSSLVYTVYKNCLMHVAIVAFIYQNRIFFDR